MRNGHFMSRKYNIRNFMELFLKAQKKFALAQGGKEREKRKNTDNRDWSKIYFI